MDNFNIYVYDNLTAPDLLSCRFEKLRLPYCAVKIGRYYYQINFYHREMVFRYFNTSSEVFYTLPGLIIVDSLEKEDLNQAIEYLIKHNYFESQKRYSSYEEIKFYPSGASYKGKRLDTVEILPLP